MRIVQITAGAGGRLCGSCLHDNALVKALRVRGRDALLVSAYVPTTTDEQNVSEKKIVMGGVNVWLQEHLPLFRRTPAAFDQLLDSRWLLQWLSSQTGSMRPSDLGALTVSTLKAKEGHQRKEVEKLARWLARDVQPDIVHLSNALLVGLAKDVREATNAKIVCSLSGEDIFIEQIQPPHYRAVRKLLRERSADVDCFVAMNQAFATFMADYLALPPAAIAVIPHGVDATGFPTTSPDLLARRQARGGRLVVGYLARACPEKGLEDLVRSLPALAVRYDLEVVAAGATVAAERDYVAGCLATAADLGVADRFQWLGQVDRAAKLRLLESIDLFVMPTVHPEAKGIPAIEAMTAGVPVVAPSHGAFPELLDHQQAGLLYRPGDPSDLVRAIDSVLGDVALAARLGHHGYALARSRYSAEQMAAHHDALYSRMLATGEGDSRDIALGEHHGQ